MNATFDSLTSLTHSSFTPFIPYPHSRHHRSTRTHVLLSLSPHTIRRRHAAASSCTSCVPHGRTTGPTSPGTALLCYSDVFCVCFVRPSAQGRLLLRVLRAFRLLRCVKLFYQIAKCFFRLPSLRQVHLPLKTNLAQQNTNLAPQVPSARTPPMLAITSRILAGVLALRLVLRVLRAGL